jgi:hypothetical protein
MDTIADIRTRKVWLAIRCEVCGRSTQIPHRLLPARLSDDLPVHLAAAFFRCQGCSGKRLVSSIYDPTANLPYSDAWHRRSA